MKTKTMRIIRIATFVMAVVLFAIVLSLGTVLLVNVNSPDAPLVIQSGESEVSESIRFENMFPGDEATTNYTVRVAHRSTVVLRFRVEQEDEVLTEALRLRVSVRGKYEPLYDGAFTGAANVPLALIGGEVTEDVEYIIVAYLKVEVGNEYQNTSVEADFVWWVEEIEQLAAIKGKTTIITLLSLGIALTVALAVVSVILIPRKGVQDGE